MCCRLIFIKTNRFRYDHILAIVQILPCIKGMWKPFLLLFTHILCLNLVLSLVSDLQKKKKKNCTGPKVPLTKETLWPAPSFWVTLTLKYILYQGTGTEINGKANGHIFLGGIWSALTVKNQFLKIRDTGSYEHPWLPASSKCSFFVHTRGPSESTSPL